LYAQLYDVAVSDRPGEIDFYHDLMQRLKSDQVNMLEIACGTGRVSLQIVSEDVTITGLDVSPELLHIAREKSADLQNVRWVLGDMRAFDLGQKFDLVIIPGHSFQFMLTPMDQVQCLNYIKRHLRSNGMLVVHLDHQDFNWLGSLPRQVTGTYSEWRELKHPLTGHVVRTANEWIFEPATQTATVTTVWEEIGLDNIVTNRWQRKPMPLHCVFRFEMDHLLKRMGYAIEAVYGDFFKNPLMDESDQMIWVARNA
jgi:ubiquinone/menaquinone biosynthesis C-methylase UbiE